MESIFENKSSTTEETMKEMVFYHTTRWLLLVYYILGVCSLVSALVLFLMGNMETTAIGCLLLTAFF